MPFNSSKWQWWQLEVCVIYKKAVIEGNDTSELFEHNQLIKQSVERLQPVYGLQTKYVHN